MTVCVIKIAVILLKHSRGSVQYSLYGLSYCYSAIFAVHELQYMFVLFLALIVDYCKIACRVMHFSVHSNRISRTYIVDTCLIQFLTSHVFKLFPWLCDNSYQYGASIGDKLLDLSNTSLHMSYPAFLFQIQIQMSVAPPVGRQKSHSVPTERCGL